MSQSSRLEPVEPAAMNGRISKYAGHLSQVDRICRGAASTDRKSGVGFAGAWVGFSCLYEDRVPQVIPSPMDYS